MEPPPTTWLPRQAVLGVWRAQWSELGPLSLTANVGCMCFKQEVISCLRGTDAAKLPSAGSSLPVRQSINQDVVFFLKVRIMNAKKKPIFYHQTWLLSHMAAGSSLVSSLLWLWTHSLPGLSSPVPGVHAARSLHSNRTIGFRFVFSLRCSAHPMVLKIIGLTYHPKG